MTDQPTRGRRTMKRTAILLAALGLGFVIVHEARAAAPSEPTLIAEVNGVSLYAVNANGLRCIVTAPQGGVSCK
jgi:hypothetical protein